MDFKSFANMYNLYQQYQQAQPQYQYQQAQPQYQYQQAQPQYQYQQAQPQYQYQQAQPQYQQSDNAAIEALSRQLNDMSMRLTSLTLSQNQPGGATEEDMVMGFFDSVINPGGNLVVGGMNNGK